MSLQKVPRVASIQGLLSESESTQNRRDSQRGREERLQRHEGSWRRRQGVSWERAAEESSQGPRENEMKQNKMAAERTDSNLRPVTAHPCDLGKVNKPLCASIS